MKTPDAGIPEKDPSVDVTHEFLSKPITEFAVYLGTLDSKTKVTAKVDLKSAESLVDLKNLLGRFSYKPEITIRCTYIEKKTHPELFNVEGVKVIWEDPELDL